MSTWTDEVEMHFHGGPMDGQTHTTQLRFCVDSISVDSDTFFCENPDGSASIMKGRRTPELRWTMFARYIYSKDAPVTDGEVSYNNTQTVEVERCQHMLQSKGRLCGNEAKHNERYCKTHIKHYALSEA